MKISIERVQPDDSSLLFVIKVTDPTDASLTEVDTSTLTFLERCKESIEALDSPENPLCAEAVSAIHALKLQKFERVLDQLRGVIADSLNMRTQHISQEIYNWIYDRQNGELKTWMQECDPQRTRYYFDNDPKFESSDMDN